ncbi:MotA/TolQ/ExbB proton channel family protein [Moraxella haemolytica]|uniref:MotA/TolQ/ExbB proton channel family protein n=1 Tax=Moraxella haemolytica TaxID=2904119 RepID=UPI0025431FE7|nr:MotA/TolQ/ExbB proton channel family protein [Moraxella sp. ZY171148]WII96093.1 MotA/TolQ/ExbB proton channel family protein [Moraxella sp. ZY171148]
MDFAFYWGHTDAVSKALFFILFALSIISWVAGIVRVVQSSRLGKHIGDDLRQSVLPSADVAGLEFSQRKMIVEQKLLQKIANYRFEMEKGLPILGTTAAIAPFIGLFGTVWGIFHALHSIAKSGQAGLAQVAGPVGEALIMTGLGLAVAIPAVLFYNIATRMNRRAIHVANDTAHQILAETAK